MSSESNELLSDGELRAEKIYYAAISRKYTHKEACMAARQLERDSPLGARYLRWLLTRKMDEWPKVGVGGNRQWI